MAWLWRRTGANVASAAAALLVALGVVAGSGRHAVAQVDGGTVAGLVARLKPAEIRKLFFDGRPFTSSTTSGNTAWTMTFRPDGTMTREVTRGAGQSGNGTWKASREGFCTRWEGADEERCFIVASRVDGRHAIILNTATVAVWQR
jgi:hypothetical protein